MKNEYGVPLDRNGYAPSIVGCDNECALCHKQLNEHLDRHEIFGGAYREKSKRLGLWVYLHHNTCHIFGKQSVHQCAKNALCLKKEAQWLAMVFYKWNVDRFRQEFGKNYLDNPEQADADVKEIWDLQEKGEM